MNAYTVFPWLLACCLLVAACSPEADNTPEELPTEAARAAPAAEATAPPQGEMATSAELPAPEETEMTAETPTPAGAEVTAGSGLAGVVVAESDVSSQPDQPLEDQLVLALPAGVAGELLGVAGTATDQLRFLRTTVPVDPRIERTRTAAGGSYAFSLPPGDYVLCLADPAGAGPLPADTRGCGRITVPPGAVRTVDVSSGFGEILLVEP